MAIIRILNILLAFEIQEKLDFKRTINSTSKLIRVKRGLKKLILLYTHLETDFMSRVISILSDDARRLFQVAFLRLLRPPVHQITLLIELSALIIKTVGDLVTNYKSNGAVIHVSRTIAGEERTLQDTSGKL